MKKKILSIIVIFLTIVYIAGCIGSTNHTATNSTSSIQTNEIAQGSKTTSNQNMNTSTSSNTQGEIVTASNNTTSTAPSASPGSPGWSEVASMSFTYYGIVTDISGMQTNIYDTSGTENFVFDSNGTTVNTETYLVYTVGTTKTAFIDTANSLATITTISGSHTLIYEITYSS